MRFILKLIPIALALLLWRFPVALLIPFSIYRILFSPEEVYLGPETWPKHGDQEDFFVHKYVYINKTLLGNPTNVTFHYIEAGDPTKEAIVFTMGASEPAIVYSEVMKHFLKDYHLISIDGKGFPYSSIHPCNRIEPDTQDPASNWDPEFQGEELVTALDAIGIKKFNLVSSDLMSIVTSLWLPKWQSRVIRYVRGQSHVGVNTYKAVPQGWIFRNFPNFSVGLLSRVRVLIWRGITGTTGISFLSQEKRTAASYQISEEFNSKVIEVLRSGSVVPWVYFWLGLPRLTILSQRNAYRELRMPVLLIQGAQDKAQPAWFYDGSVRLEFLNTGENDTVTDETVVGGFVYQDSEEEKEKWKAEKYFSSSKWVKLVWIQESGHFPHFEVPDEYAENMKRFFKDTAELVD